MSLGVNPLQNLRLLFAWNWMGLINWEAEPSSTANAARFLTINVEETA